MRSVPVISPLVFCAQSSVTPINPNFRSVRLTPYNREVSYTAELPVEYMDYCILLAGRCINLGCNLNILTMKVCDVFLL